MANRWKVTSFVALALLGCLAVPEVEAQKGAPPAQAPKVKYVPQYPPVPQVHPAAPPKVPYNQQASQVQQAAPQNNPNQDAAPQYKQYTPQKAPNYRQAPEVQQAAPQKAPQQAPQIQQAAPPKVTQYQQVPQVHQPAQKKAPRKKGLYHDLTQQAAPQKAPEHRPDPQVLPAPKRHALIEPVESCEVAANVRVPCGLPDISAAGCESINCCFDGQQCYFGKAVTVQCTKNAQFIVVVARDATLPNIDLESISLLGEDQGCGHVDSNSEFAIYQFSVTDCGSIVMEEPGVIVYENRMSSQFEVQVGHLGSITRDSHYELLFQCRYIGTSIETVVVEVKPENRIHVIPVAALGPLNVLLTLANGECSTKGCIESDVAYSSFYRYEDYPVTKVLREPVYVQVQLLEKPDPNLVLTLGRCWTTASPNPHSLPQWDILIDGCPYRNDRYLSSLVPVDYSSGLEFPRHYRRFIFKMFTFVDPNSMEPLHEQVYIHCSTTVCNAVEGPCEPSCNNKYRRDVRAAERKADPKVVVSVGPVDMTAAQQ